MIFGQFYHVYITIESISSFQTTPLEYDWEKSAIQ